MFESFTAPKEDAIAILKQDHSKVKELFKKFEESDSLREKKRIAAEAIMELKIHAEIEEKIFYPAVRGDVEDDIMNEADEEHHVAKLLIAELDQMDGSERHWEAKFIVLAENIRHHIKEEEGEMMPQARKVDVDMTALGRRMLSMKQLLKKNGVPPCEEELLMAGTHARMDSPARAASGKPAPSIATNKAKTMKKAGARSTAKSMASVADGSKKIAAKRPTGRSNSAKRRND